MRCVFRKRVGKWEIRVFEVLSGKYGFQFIQYKYDRKLGQHKVVRRLYIAPYDSEKHRKSVMALLPKYLQEEAQRVIRYYTTWVKKYDEVFGL